MNIINPDKRNFIPHAQTSRANLKPQKSNCWNPSDPRICSKLGVQGNQTRAARGGNLHIENPVVVVQSGIVTARLQLGDKVDVRSQFDSSKVCAREDFARQVDLKSLVRIGYSVGKMGVFDGVEPDHFQPNGLQVFPVEVFLGVLQVFVVSKLKPLFQEYFASRLLTCFVKLSHSVFQSLAKFHSRGLFAVLPACYAVKVITPRAVVEFT